MAAAVTRPCGHSRGIRTVSLYRSVVRLSWKYGNVTVPLGLLHPRSLERIYTHIYISSKFEEKKDGLGRNSSGKSHVTRVQLKKQRDIFKPRRSLIKKTDCCNLKHSHGKREVSFRIFETRMNILSANRDPFRSFPVLFSLPPVSRPPSPLLITTRAKGTLKFRFAQFQTPPLYRERSSVYTRNWSPTCSSQLSRIVTTLLFQTIRVIELRVFLIFRLNVLHFNDNWGDKWTEREGERESQDRELIYQSVHY